MSRLTFDREVEVLIRYAENAKLGVVEIGLFDGETTREMSHLCRVPMYGIDPIVPDSMPNYAVGNADSIRFNMAHYPAFTFYQDYSYNVVDGFDKPFDFLFIDGSHIYEDTRRDFIDWFPKLAPGGFVAFHDSAPRDGYAFQGWPGPVRYTAEIRSVGYPVFVERMDTLQVFRK